MEKLKHNIDPIYDKNSQILILGSFPSPISRKNQIFYGNPQNRFWIILAKIFNEKVPETITEKRNFVIQHKIALWDVVEQCEIDGASDSSIRNVIPNDIDKILKTANIKAIFTTGKTATKLFKKYFKQDSIYLPSSSPANFAYSFDDLIKEYQKILNYLKEN